MVVRISILRNHVCGVFTTFIFWLSKGTHNLVVSLHDEGRVMDYQVQGSVQFRRLSNSFLNGRDKLGCPCLCQTAIDRNDDLEYNLSAFLISRADEAGCKS